MLAGTIVLVLLAALGAAVWVRFRNVRQELSEQNRAVDKAWERVERAMRGRAAVAVKLAEACGELPGRGDDVIRDVKRSAAEVDRATDPKYRLKANTNLDAELSRMAEAIDRQATGAVSGRVVNLREELSAASNDLAVERTNYNESVQRYNTALALFPNNLAASLFGYERRDLYFHPPPRELP